jgi:uncharacterized protein (TIGR03545 family)
MSDIKKSNDKKQKKKGPIRFEAIIPVAILSLLTFIYFSYYFDHHLKKVFEYVGTQANGAEVNVDLVKTSFLSGSFELDRLQVTNPERPSHNSLEIGSMRFQYLWDALLRMKFVVKEASITNIQLMKPRSRPGYVLPPKPASPSKIEALQNQVIAQVKNKYSANILGDMMVLLEGGDYQDQLQKIRETLKSENRAKEMVSDVNAKKEFWDKKVKELSDTSKIKEIDSTIQAVRSEKNVLEQAKSVKKLTDLLKDVEGQYREIEKSSKTLQSEVKALSNYPKELQNLVNEDVASLKQRLSVPQIDFKDMAMHLFAGDFAEYIAKARKYQSLAEQYLPEKKKEENVVIPPKRSEGKNYQFPITTGYPLFWLKRAAISSKGTAESYSGQVSGELTNVTTSPKQIKKPIRLELKGDFPASNIMGVSLVLGADLTQEVSSYTSLLQVNSFNVPEKMFVNDNKLKFGFQKANASTTLSARLEGDQVKMKWISAITKPQFLVETSNKIAKEILSNVVNNIPVINISGTANGPFSNLNMDVTSNLGTELGQGFTREIGAKVFEAQNKINTLVEEKINLPKEQLLSSLNDNSLNVNKLSDLQKLYRNNEDKIKAEIDKLKNGKGMNDLKEKGKKLLKGIKF